MDNSATELPAIQPASLNPKAKLVKDNNKPHPLDVSQEQPILSDPKMQPKVARGLVEVEVLKNMTYLEGRFHNAGAKLKVPTHEADAAISIKAARPLKLEPVKPVSQTAPAGEQ